jgi:hypothetical protein
MATTSWFTSTPQGKQSRAYHEPVFTGAVYLIITINETPAIAKQKQASCQVRQPEWVSKGSE